MMQHLLHVYRGSDGGEVLVAVRVRILAVDPVDGPQRMFRPLYREFNVCLFEFTVGELVIRSPYKS